MFFSKSSIYPIGLDISDLSLKLVQLNKVGNKIKIQALGQVPVPEGLIVAGDIKDMDKVAAIIKKLIASPKFGKVSSEAVVACLPETQTFVKLIEIEKTPNNLADTIEVEIEKHVPLPINDTFYDWQVISEKGNIQQVLIGVAPKKIVNQYTDLLDKARLSVESLEIEPIAICRSLLGEEKPNFKSLEGKNYAIIDIGASRTSMIFYAKNTIIFTVSIPISGEKITNSIASSLDIEKAQAEKAKIICGLNEDKAGGIINKVLAGTIDELNNKIKEVFAFDSNHFAQYGPINKILLCGGGANIVGIDKIISQAVSMEVVKGDPLVNLGDAREKFLKLLSETYSLDEDFSKHKKNDEQSRMSITQDASSVFSTAIGLALRGIFIDKI